MILRDLMSDKRMYESVKSTPSSMDKPSAQALEYILDLFSISVILTLKKILGHNIFVPVGNE